MTSPVGNSILFTPLFSFNLYKKINHMIIFLLESFLFVSISSDLLIMHNLFESIKAYVPWTAVSRSVSHASGFFLTISAHLLYFSSPNMLYYICTSSSIWSLYLNQAYSSRCVRFLGFYWFLFWTSHLSKIVSKKFWLNEILLNSAKVRCKSCSLRWRNTQHNTRVSFCQKID